MRINSLNGINAQTGQMGMDQATDSYSRNLQNQIANLQKQLQELSSKEEMTLEEKMKKRQELQQQISDLNMQFRQHQIEQRNAAMNGSEKQQENGLSMDEMTGGSKSKAGGKSTGLSQASMTAILSADASMKQAKVQGSVAASMEGRAGVLEAEIKTDGARGGDTTKKQEELANVEQKAVNATASQMSTLAGANKAVEEAAAAESTENQASDTKEEKEAQAENEAAKTAENVPPVETAASEAQTAVYTHVNVQL